ncbi:MAG: hypothetical protein LC713_00920 [Actinobacteria bacterium]|nr:hypothetical protein [Actinomycetota bacterium]
MTSATEASELVALAWPTVVAWPTWGGEDVGHRRCRQRRLLGFPAAGRAPVSPTAVGLPAALTTTTVARPA